MTAVLQYGAEWLLTWLMHATVACLLALALAKWLVSDPRLRDLLWKAALVLPLAASVLSVAAHPITANVLELASFARSHMPFALRSARVAVGTTSGLANSAQIHVQDSLVQWLRWLLLGGMLIPAVVATSRLVRSRYRLWRDLRMRRPTTEQELDVDARMLRLAGKTARISVAPQIGSAAALGSCEICVSDDFLTLGRLEQQGVLAHEMAHLTRRDPAWMALADVLASMLAIQPLVRAVARRLRRDAEFVCDEIAVRQTGNAVAYVRALTMFAEKQAEVPAAALAYGSSRIVQRAERVLALRAQARGTSTRLGLVFVLGLMAIMLLALPRVRTGEASAQVRAHVSRQVSSAVGAPAQIHVTIDVH